MIIVKNKWTQQNEQTLIEKRHKMIYYKMVWFDLIIIVIIKNVRADNLLLIKY